MAVTLTREQLYELVWSEPMQRLAKQIGISDVAIAKHCRKTGIPVPTRGYWAKLQAGKKPTKQDLPPRDLSTINTINMSGALTSELQMRCGDNPSGDENAESIEVMTVRFRKRLGRVRAPIDFSIVHPRIQTILLKDEERRKENERNQYSWPKPEFDSPLDQRRLRIINGIFLGVGSVGGDGWVRGDKAAEIGVHIGGAHVSWTLKESGCSRKGGIAASERNSKLKIELGQYYASPGIQTKWEDRPGARLERQLTEIIVGMAVASEHSHRRWIAQKIEWERQRREEDERERREQAEEAERQERARLAEIEKAKIDKLRRHAADWREAESIRAYISAIRATTTGKVDAAIVERWTRWATAEADKIDPLSSGAAANTLLDFGQEQEAEKSSDSTPNAA